MVGYLRLADDGFTISNPGGFVEGVTLDNFLTVPPIPRNPNLADALKRIGLAERTGRGVDRIFEGMLRFGRPAPDYSATTPTQVLLHFQRAVADHDFMRLLMQEEQRIGSPLPVDALIFLSRLKEERRLNSDDLAKAAQRSESQARTMLERLVEADLIEAHGSGRGRTFMLSARVYQKTGQHAAYVRQAGFDAIQQEQMVLKYTETHGKITRRDAVELCRIGSYQAARLLHRLAVDEKLQMHGKRRGTYYVRYASKD